MSVKVGTTFSDRKPVTGGSPQGSILGNFLFCASTDEFNNLEAENVTREMPSSIPQGPLINTSTTSNSSGSSYDQDYNDGDDSFNFFRPKKKNPLDDTEISFRLEQN